LCLCIVYSRSRASKVSIWHPRVEAKGADVGYEHLSNDEAGSKLEALVARPKGTT
jgi:hypothetical protein